MARVFGKGSGAAGSGAASATPSDGDVASGGANSDAKQLADGDVYAAASDEIVEGAEGGVEHDAFAEADDDVSPTSPEVATLNPRPDVNEAHAGLL